MLVSGRVSPHCTCQTNAVHPRLHFCALFHHSLWSGEPSATVDSVVEFFCIQMNSDLTWRTWHHDDWTKSNQSQSKPKKYQTIRVLFEEVLGHQNNRTVFCCYKKQRVLKASISDDVQWPVWPGPDDVLRKGSGTLCESLLMNQAPKSHEGWGLHRLHAHKDVFGKGLQILMILCYVLICDVIWYL